MMARKITTSFGIFLLLGTFLCCDAFLTNYNDTVNKEPFSFDDIFNSSLNPRSFTVDWVPGEDSFTYTDSNGDLVLYNITSNSTYILLTNEELNPYDDYWVSADLNFVLLASNIQDLWRHSFIARYAVYDLSAGTVVQFPQGNNLQNKYLQYVGWAPIGHALAFVYENDLYYQESPVVNSVKITDTGKRKVIFNGVPDWLYEEEILAQNHAIWWSPDAQYITYAEFNCTNVPLFKFPYYGPKNNVYGDIIEIAYPKSGDLTPNRNTVAQLKVVNVMDLAAAAIPIPPPSDLISQEHYFLHVQWLNSSQLAVAWANRVQNRTIHSVCDILLTSLQCNVTLDRSVDNGWVEILPDMRPAQKGDDKLYATIVPATAASTPPDGEQWKTLALVYINKEEGSDIDYVNPARKEVLSVAGSDGINLYFVSTVTEQPGVRALYQVNINIYNEVCLTCDQPNCTYISVSFSDTGNYYILGCRGPSIPYYVLKSTLDFDFEIMLEDNKDVEEKLSKKDLPRVEFMDVDIGNGLTGKAKLLIPSSVDMDPNLMLPLIVEVYGGPGSQAVNTAFSTGYETYLASTHNVVYAFIDGRGTTGRGEEFKHELYRKMATLEIEDQLRGTEYLIAQLDFIDPDKNVAVMGWSYGGFATAHALANESNTFQCGISGAALIDRRFYDTAHSERYMGFATPEDNQEGYERTDITKKVANFKNKHLLVVHGTADDNVHFASSAQMVKALTEEQIQFRFQLYTDLNHYFASSSRHLYHLYDNFLFNDCWHDSEAMAIVKRETRVMNKNIKLHAAPDASARKHKRRNRE